MTIRVVPFSAGGVFGGGSATLFACGPVPQLDTVQVDVLGGVSFLHAQTHLANYRTVLERMERRSLAPDRSREFIGTVVREL